MIDTFAYTIVPGFILEERLLQIKVDFFYYTDVFFGYWGIGLQVSVLKVAAGVIFGLFWRIIIKILVFFTENKIY